MAYLGNTAANRFVAPKAASVFSGDGSEVNFTLDHSVGSDEDILVSVDGVIQEPSVAYSVSNGTTLTFTAAPSSNSGNNIFVYYLFRTVGTVSHPSNNAFTASTGTFTGAVTANAGVTVDNITIDGNDISSTNSDGDILFKGNDGGSTITALTLDMSEGGQVGVGTTSPQRQLHIAGGSNTGLKISGNNSGATSSDGFDIFVRDDNNGVELVQRENEFMTFHSNDTERMRIRGDGQVGIGTTGGSAQFQVLKASGDIVYFQNSSGTGAKLTAGNQSFSAVSDENKKESIVELDKQQSYDNIKNIRAVTYKFKDIEITDDDGKKTTYVDDKNRIGFIAQDWETKYSQLVNTDDEGVKSLLYTETTPVLLSALQKAQEKIEALEARIIALENK
jgi:hypothetical protein